jgi:hypothetical protein
MYTLALVAGLLDVKWFKWALAAALMVGYAVYVRRHFASPGEATEEAWRRGSSCCRACSTRATSRSC